VSSTIGPTVALIEEEADRAGRSVVVTSTVVADAWSAFESGDHAGYSAKVAAALSRVDGADVIVLAQASMARAADGWAGPVPVLCSPRPGFRAAAAVAADSGEETRDRLL
jgi:hypothetical protein